MLFVFNCKAIKFSKILVSNIIGIGKLFNIQITSKFQVFSGKIQTITTFSIFVFEFLQSNISFSDMMFIEFYPQLIYASYSSITLDNCSFSDSYEKKGDFEISAIFLEYNNTFRITNCKFESLQNNYNGAVIFF